MSLEPTSKSPPEPSGPKYSARVALGFQPGHAPGPVLLRAPTIWAAVIDDRLRVELGPRYDRHSAQSVGADKLTVIFTLRGDSPAVAVRAAGLAAATLIELLTDTGAAIDVSGIALVVRAQ